MAFLIKENILSTFIGDWEPFTDFLHKNEKNELVIYVLRTIQERLCKEEYHAVNLETAKI